MDDQTFRSAFLTLFTEAFEGKPSGAPGTWFVEKSESLLDALETLSAEEASKRPNENVSSVAAHLDHARYYVSVSNAFARGEKPELNWEESWRLQQVTDEEWKQLANDLKNEYDELKGHVSSANLESNEIVAGIMANLAHAAFHLGAVRLLMRLTSASYSHQ